MNALSISFLSTIPTSFPSFIIEILPTSSFVNACIASANVASEDNVYAGVLIIFSTGGDIVDFVPWSSSLSILAYPALIILRRVTIPTSSPFFKTGNPDKPVSFMFSQTLEIWSLLEQVFTSLVIISWIFLSGMLSVFRFLKMSTTLNNPASVISCPDFRTGTRPMPAAIINLAASIMSISGYTNGYSDVKPSTVTFDLVEYIFNNSFSVRIPMTLFFALTTGRVL